MRSFRIRKRLSIAVALFVIALAGVCSYIAIRHNFYRQDSIEFCGRMLKIAPGSVKANNNMAQAYEKAGMHDEAMDVYANMLKQNPNHPDVYVNLAAIWIIKRNPDEAIALCEKAIALEPGNATAHNNLAVAYYLRGDYDLAIEHCDLAVKYGYKVKPELVELLKPYRE